MRARRHHGSGGPFSGVSLLLIAELGCSASIAATWEVSQGSAKPLLSWQKADYVTYLLGHPRAVLQCVHAGPTAGAPVAGNGLEEPLPCCRVWEKCGLFVPKREPSLQGSQPGAELHQHPGAETVPAWGTGSPWGKWMLACGPSLLAVICWSPALQGHLVSPCLARAPRPAQPPARSPLPAAGRAGSSLLPNSLACGLA